MVNVIIVWRNEFRIMIGCEEGVAFNLIQFIHFVCESLWLWYALKAFDLNGISFIWKWCPFLSMPVKIACRNGISRKIVRLPIHCKKRNIHWTNEFLHCLSFLQSHFIKSNKIWRKTKRRAVNATRKEDDGKLKGFATLRVKYCKILSRYVFVLLALFFASPANPLSSSHAFVLSSFKRPLFLLPILLTHIPPFFQAESSLLFYGIL